MTAKTTRHKVFAKGDRVMMAESLAFHDLVRTITAADDVEEIAFLDNLTMLGKAVPVPYALLERAE